MDLEAITRIGVILLVAGLPVAVIVLLIVVTVRRLSGKRSRFDGLLGGVARANAQSWHLQGGGPHPDDAAVPIPPRRGIRPRRRPRR